MKAIGYRAGKAVVDFTQWTAGEPSSVKLKTMDGDVAEVSISVEDDAGHFVPTANRVDLKVTGPARLMGLENGNPTNVTPNKSRIATRLLVF